MPKESKKTSIGGQALIEGVMMRGPKVSAMATRMPDGSIDTELIENRSVRDRVAILKLPLLRGVVNFIEMLVFGYKCMMKSAKKAGFDEDETPSPFEQKMIDRFGPKFGDALMMFSAFLGVVLAVGLFLVLPTLAVKGLSMLVDLGGWRTLMEGVIKIVIFVAYLYLVSRMEEIKRVFGYHGAEHKTIACYEAGEELTVENARKFTRFHPRCGTSFLLIVLVLSILVFSVVTWDSLLIRLLLKLALMPVVVGIGYEIIRLAGRHDNPLTRAISAPGLWLQRLTTNEPEDGQLEVAIASILPVIPHDDSDQW